ncbi:keratin 99 [Trichomycterus rosablanca]|uniref:keratin 99 n=1 Tax=Trichomycterus rosablanca TaxID=2290929 RepID=UPI002F34FC6E
MAGTLRRSFSYSMYNLNSSTGEIMLNKMDNSRRSIYGRHGTYISGFPSSAVDNEVPQFDNEKLTMQNLNIRLASYLEKVKCLDSANRKLELQIKEFFERKSPNQQKDLTRYYSIIEDLQKQILARTKENSKILMAMDNIKMTAHDFKAKYEMEMSKRLGVEADTSHMKVVLGELNVTNNDLEFTITGLNEDMVFLKKSHEEDLYLLHTQQSGAVNVEIDCAPAVDLEKELQEMREQYEVLLQKNHRELEQWFQSKVEVLNSEITTSHTEIKSSQTAYTDLQKKYQSLEIEVNSVLHQKEILQRDLAEVGVRYSSQMTKLQLDVNRLEQALQQINESMQQQASDYQILLDIKMRLELEIAEYRRLLGGEGGGSVSVSSLSTSSKTSSLTTTVSETVRETVTDSITVQEQKEEEHHLHQKRLKVITEQLVDGVVVSTSVVEKIMDEQLV